MSDMDSSTLPNRIAVVQDSYPVEVAKRGRVIGVILHRDGTLRMFKDPATERVVVEVSGFYTADGREFLADLQWFADLAPEILVCDDPSGWDEPEIRRERHYRVGA